MKRDVNPGLIGETLPDAVAEFANVRATEEVIDAVVLKHHVFAQDGHASEPDTLRHEAYLPVISAPVTNGHDNVGIGRDRRPAAQENLNEQLRSVLLNTAFDSLAGIRTNYDCRTRGDL